MLLSGPWGWTGSKRQASARLAQCRAAEGGPGLPFTREGPLGEDGWGDRVGGSNTWSEAAFASPAFEKFKTVIQ